MAVVRIDWNPPVRHLKQFAAIWFPAFLAVVGAILWFRFGLQSTAAVIWCVGAVLCVVGFFVPPVMRWVWVGVMLVTFPIGWVISHAILAMVFYLLLTPVGLLMRAIGYDPMHRRFDRSAKTYWREHETTEDPSRYFRQY